MNNFKATDLLCHQRPGFCRGDTLLRASYKPDEFGDIIAVKIITVDTETPKDYSTLKKATQFTFFISTSLAFGVTPRIS